MQDEARDLVQADFDELGIEARCLMRDRLLAEEIWGNLGLPVEECAAFVDRSEMKGATARTSSRGSSRPSRTSASGGPKIREAHGSMGIPGFANVDIEALGKHDERVAEALDSGVPTPIRAEDLRS